MPLTGTKLTWQVFPPRQPSEGVFIVLVLTVQETILSQYESVCETVGLLPQEVAVASFRLFDLWLRSAGGARRLSRDLAWITIADNGLTCFIIHEGRPVFVRTKLLTGEPIQEGDVRPHAWVAKIVREIGMSLLACQEQYPNLQLKNLVLMTECDFPGLKGALTSELGVATEQVHWDLVETLGWSYDGGSPSMAALPVVAGMV